MIKGRLNPVAEATGYTTQPLSGFCKTRYSFLLEFFDPAGSIRFRYTLMDSPLPKEYDIKIVGISP